MTDKELRRLKREEWREMLISQSKEVEELRAEVSELKKKLDDRQICLDKAGSIAEASVLLNGVFEAAQAAAQQAAAQQAAAGMQNHESIPAAIPDGTAEIPSGQMNGAQTVM